MELKEPTDPQKQNLQKSLQLLPSSMTRTSKKLSKVVSSKETPQSSFLKYFLQLLPPAETQQC